MDRNLIKNRKYRGGRAQKKIIFGYSSLVKRGLSKREKYVELVKDLTSKGRTSGRAAAYPPLSERRNREGRFGGLKRTYRTVGVL